MSFGTDLSKEFSKLTNNVMLDEVCLFTKLQDAFINLKSSGTCQYNIDIIHGNTSFVDFNFNSTWVSTIPLGQSVTRELADMMFVIYSKRKNQIRITYMQNKKGRTDNKFNADLCQLHLLSQREHITSTKLPDCLFGNPDMLSHAILPSVGSYGVFYKSNQGVEMSYYPASLISPSKLAGKSVTRTAEYDTSNYGCTPKIHGYVECQGARQIKDFGDALVNMQIGTPILHGTSAHKELIMFLSHYVADIMQSSWIEESRDYIHEPNQQTWTPSVPVIYAINADKKERDDDIITNP